MNPSPGPARRIRAAYDDETIVVYQAYSPAIGRWAAAHGAFGSGFSFGRMSWIKPNFLWMMYRSGWGTKPGQETTLAIRLRRTFFDSLLAWAVPSHFDGRLYDSYDRWRQAVAESEVRLQWDPDRDPGGAPLFRRAIQLGLRGAALAGWGGRELLDVRDVSDFVAEQRPHAASGAWDLLHLPEERDYPVPDPAVAHRLGLSEP